MNHELWYTSAPRGLDAGTSGFCTVKATQSMPVQLKTLLESLSSYRPVFPPTDSNGERNPVNFASVVARIGGKKWHILSRIQTAGLDYTNRGNFFAHHVALALPGPLVSSPTKLLSTLASKWDFRVEQLVSCRPLTGAVELLRPCLAWQAVTGDPGWAGVLAQRLAANERVHLVFSPGMSLFPLVAELLALFPIEKQWTTTFSTYYCNASQMVDCQLRCVLAGSEEHRSAEASRAFVLNLSTQLGPVRQDGPLVAAARTGTVAAFAEPAADVPAPDMDTGSVEPPLGSPKPGSRARQTPPRAAEPGMPMVRATRTVSPIRTEASPSTESRSTWMLLAGSGAGVVLACLFLVPVILWSYSRFQNAERQITELQAAANESKSKAADLERARQDLQTQLRSQEDLAKERGEGLATMTGSAQHNAKLVEERDKKIEGLQTELNTTKTKLSEALTTNQGLMTKLKDTEQLLGNSKANEKELGELFQKLKDELQQTREAKEKPSLPEMLDGQDPTDLLQPPAVKRKLRADKLRP